MAIDFKTRESLRHPFGVKPCSRLNLLCRSHGNTPGMVTVPTENCGVKAHRPLSSLTKHLDRGCDRYQQDSDNHNPKTGSQEDCDCDHPLHEIDMYRVSQPSENYTRAANIIRMWKSLAVGAVKEGVALKNPGQTL